MNKKKQVLPMYFSTLEIENIKTFGSKQILDLKDSNGNISPWTLILGDNGVGKTTLLKCLAWMIPVEETDKDKSGIEKNVAIKPAMDDFEEESSYEKLVRVGSNIKSRVGATFTQGAELSTKPTNSQLVSHSISISTKDGKLQEIELEFGELKEFNTVNLFAYSASRHMGLKNFDQPDLKDPVSNLFSTSGDLYDAEQILTNLEFASLKEGGAGKSTELLNKIKLVLADLLPDVQRPENIVINSPIKDDGTLSSSLIEVKTPFADVPLDSLSLGYQTMLAWSVDLALRMFWRNPECDNPLAQPAVVLVDEVDLHLHPKWQRIVRSYLTTHFPCTQFICTAHSPIMAQSSERENMCIVNRVNNEAYIENSPQVVFGWKIGQIVSNLFGIPERGPEIVDLERKRTALLGKSRLSKEEKSELHQLDERLNSLPIAVSEEDQQILNKIREAALLLKREGGIK